MIDLLAQIVGLVFLFCFCFILLFWFINLLRESFINVSIAKMKELNELKRGLDIDEKYEKSK